MNFYFNGETFAADFRHHFGDAVLYLSLNFDII